jgi:hypothetical protein
MEPKFEVQWQGEPRPRKVVPLSELARDNRDAPEIAEWLPRAPVNGSLVVGGGAAPAVSIRRVS